MTQALFTVPTTGNYTDSVDGGKYRYTAGQVIPLDWAVRLGMPGAAPSDVPERTATADGTGAGQIAAGIPYVTVTSDDADKIITLPDADVGTVVALRNGATGYELRTHAPASVAINGGSGANAESAIPADTYVVCRCDTEATWLCHEVATNGVISTVEVAAP